MISSEEARQIVSQIVGVDNKIMLRYISQQEKKDELLELYRKKDRLELFLRYKKDIDIVDRNYCCNELSKIRNQIKILNEV